MRRVSTLRLVSCGFLGAVSLLPTASSGEEVKMRRLIWHPLGSWHTGDLNFNHQFCHNNLVTLLIHQHSWQVFWIKHRHFGKAVVSETSATHTKHLTDRLWRKQRTKCTASYQSKRLKFSTTGFGTCLLPQEKVCVTSHLGD